ncbi:DinB family protein [Chryseobacterium sp. WG14]|uniref:DinB family protein n=1 Tax=Chryseobacterium sp. WG14 TaxID=2926909 RepID=UPI00211DDB39|nr:DinB family protein [Chryseobacterium sp. WG14]
MTLSFHLLNKNKKLFKLFYFKSTIEDLNRKCLTPANHEITVWKWLRAMIEHEIHHRAALYIYLNLLDVKTPQIYGLSAEEAQKMSVKL